MAASIATKAGRRAVSVEAAIREALAEGDSKRAVTAAVDALRSEVAHLARQRPGDAALIGAELAANIAAVAAGLHQHKPPRPAGCRGLPTPAHLLAVHEAALATAQENGGTP